MYMVCIRASDAAHDGLHAKLRRQHFAMTENRYHASRRCKETPCSDFPDIVRTRMLWTPHFSGGHPANYWSRWDPERQACRSPPQCGAYRRHAENTQDLVLRCRLKRKT